MRKIGERIKKRREVLHLHLNELAEKVEISSSALSQIENSKSYPSVLTLKSIADALHTTIGDLVGENEIITFNPVVLSNEAKQINESETGAELFLLSDSDINKHMDSFLIRLKAGANVKGLFANKHSQVFCRVLSGSVKFELSNKTYELKQGDNIYFDSWLQHDISNNYEAVSEIIWVQSPPDL